VDGFHALETNNDLRWTDGDATPHEALFEDFGGATEPVLQLGGPTRYAAFAPPVGGSPHRPGEPGMKLHTVSPEQTSLAIGTRRRHPQRKYRRHAIKGYWQFLGQAPSLTVS
jgi:hypothetical protein